MEVKCLQSFTLAINLIHFTTGNIMPPKSKRFDHQKKLAQTINFEIHTTQKINKKVLEAGSYTLRKLRKGSNTYLEILDGKQSPVRSMRAIMFAKCMDLDKKFNPHDPIVKDLTNQVLSSTMISYLHAANEM